MQIQGQCILFATTPFLPFLCYTHDTMKHPTSTLSYRLIHLGRASSGGQKQRLDILEDQSNPQGIDLRF